MKRSALIALSLGLALFIALLAWRGVDSVTAALAAGGWGLLAVAAFHLLPLLIDAAGLHVLGGVDGLPRASSKSGSFSRTLSARWVGESVNSLLPAGQMGGPLVMARLLGHQRGELSHAGALVTVATTQQMLAQAVFALMGVALLSLHASDGRLLWPLVIGIAAFGVGAALFLRLQQRGLFRRVVGLLARMAIGHDREALMHSAARLDAGVESLYRRTPAVRASFALNLLGWLVGTGEVWLVLQLLGHPVSWADALMLESLGQAIRGIAFAIPGALGVQEGGYLLLAPLVGLPPDAALALSLCKRARELLLGIPGLVFWHWSERGRLRRLNAVAAVD